MKVYIRPGKDQKYRFATLPKASLLALRKYWLTHCNPDLVFPAGNQKSIRADLMLCSYCHL